MDLRSSFDTYLFIMHSNHQQLVNRAQVGCGVLDNNSAIDEKRPKPRVISIYMRRTGKIAQGSKEGLRNFTT